MAGLLAVGAALPCPQALGRRSCSFPHYCSTAQQPAGPWSVRGSQVSIRSWSVPACLLWLCRGRQGQQLLEEESTWHVSCSSAACHSTAACCHLLLGLPGEEMCFHPDVPGARAPYAVTECPQAAAKPWRGGWTVVLCQRHAVAPLELGCACTAGASSVCYSVGKREAA